MCKILTLKTNTIVFERRMHTIKMQTAAFRAHNFAIVAATLWAIFLEPRQEVTLSKVDEQSAAQTHRTQSTHWHPCQTQASHHELHPVFEKSQGAPTCTTPAKSSSVDIQIKLCNCLSRFSIIYAHTSNSPAHTAQLILLPPIARPCFYQFDQKAPWQQTRL